MTNRDDSRPVVLTRASSELEGILIVGRLESVGILAQLAGAGLAGWRAEAPAWVQVMVQQRDESRARKLLAEWKDSKGAGGGGLDGDGEGDASEEI